MEPKARTGIFLGYAQTSKAYRVYGIEAGQVVISRDVNLNEGSFRLSPPTINEDVNDIGFDSFELHDTGPGQVQYKQTGKPKSRPN